MYSVVPSFKLAMNQALWKAVEPSEYYMEVTELSLPRGVWHWAIHVQDGHPISIQLLDKNMYREDMEEESRLDPNNLTVDQIFTLAGQLCTDVGFLDCSIKFDPHFHYPKLVDAYEMSIIKVEQFVSCEETEEECPSHQ